MNEWKKKREIFSFFDRYFRHWTLLPYFFSFIIVLTVCVWLLLLCRVRHFFFSISLVHFYKLQVFLITILTNNPFYVQERRKKRRKEGVVNEEVEEVAREYDEGMRRVNWMDWEDFLSLLLLLLISFQYCIHFYIKHRKGGDERLKLNENIK